MILLEILIGLLLTGVLLSSLFTSITRVAKIETKLETTRAALLTRQHLHMRLQDLFMGLTHLHTQHLPHETQESLIATFKNGIDPDPAFSGEVLGRIYLDENHDLCLAIWPLDEEKLWRKEILLPNVKKFQFSFLGPTRKEDGAQAINATLAWHNRWSKERSNSPSLIRLEIEEKNTPLQFAFPLPSSDHIVTYWKGGHSS